MGPTHTSLPNFRMSMLIGIQNLLALEIGVLSDGVDRDSGGESGCRAQAGRDFLSWLEPLFTSTVPTHPV